LVAGAGYAEYYTAPETHWIDLKWAGFREVCLKTQARFPNWSSCTAASTTASASPGRPVDRQWIAAF